VKLIQLIDTLKTKLKKYPFAQVLIIANINMKRSADNNVSFGTGTYKFIRLINDRFENARIFTFCKKRKQKFQFEISRKIEKNNEKTSL